MKTVGILGGMGPEATSDFYMRIIKIFQERFNAKYDSDFPQIIINSIPLPDIVETSENEGKIKEMLIRSCKLLENAGAEFIAIPCNSVSKFILIMRESVKIPVLSIIETAISTLKTSKIGILGTNYTIQNRLYEKLLIEKGKEVILPDETEQKEVTQVIMSILANKDIEKAIISFNGIINKLKERGAEEIILGCTELPLIANKENYLIDTLQTLAEKTVNLSLK
jgi:aspartate racemase